MTDARFLQIHWLASYPAALLNRDDAGLAKRIPFGGATRARVSSQCQKRRLRMAGALSIEDAGAGNQWALQNLGVPMGVRTKEVVEDRIMPGALAKVIAPEDMCKAVEAELLIGLYAKAASDPKKRQALFFGQPEIEFLVDLAAAALAQPDAKSAGEAMKETLKDQRQNMNALKNGAGLESALFGRMVTSDTASNRDAAIHVAHAFTVHTIERELDFMTVVDDLKNREEGDDAGAAGVFDMELASGLYYGYVVVDVPLLVSNLSDDRQIAAKVVEHLLHLIAQVSPGAKKGSTAPYAWAELVLVESGDRQPRTLANAFRDAVSLKTNRLAGATIDKMAAHLAGLDAAYGNGERRRQLAVGEDRLPGINVLALDDLAVWAADRVRGEVRR